MRKDRRVVGRSRDGKGPLENAEDPRERTPSGAQAMASRSRDDDPGTLEIFDPLLHHPFEPAAGGISIGDLVRCEPALRSGGINEDPKGETTFDERPEFNIAEDQEPERGQPGCAVDEPGDDPQIGDRRYRHRKEG